MAEYVESVDIDTDPQALFDYLADVGNLPRYMPRLQRAEEVGDGAVEVTATPRLADGTRVEVTGTAWTRVDSPGHTFSWGAVGGRHGYRGSFEIERYDGGARLTVSIVSERADAESVRGGLRDVLGSIKRLTERSGTA
ncbi:SRPBCC family protein [Mobilicoccus massiliensis]|uniref:SRPBCC family protein n=1 Tax=Mobilicoccus massiliensis TaxID=1522310 RepID=UPI00058F755C|nr:SRPBCC family protein [Mobilicoccus massiliensis]